MYVKPAGREIYGQRMNQLSLFAVLRSTSSRPECGCDGMCFRDCQLNFEMSTFSGSRLSDDDKSDYHIRTISTTVEFQMVF